MNKEHGKQTQREVIKRALVEIEELRAKLRDKERARGEDVAVIGMACRLPGHVNSPEDYWELLDRGGDAVGPMPRDRTWRMEDYYHPEPMPGRMYVRQGGFVDDIAQFDADFFGISPREAASVDPQQRLALEVTWEALENAGIPENTLEGSSTGVFIGAGMNDYVETELRSGDPAAIGPYSGTGSIFSVIAGRISFVFGLQGPTMTIDTACSSSLVAIHEACMSLRNRECPLAVAGGVQLNITPAMFLFLCSQKGLAPDGRCKTFDESADGFVRSEGCGIVVLKLLSEAKRDGDNILAVIRGSAVNHDGRSSGLTVPNGRSQQELLRKALFSAKLKPLDIGYVEAHGTGTSLGDPIEMQALLAVYGAKRPSRNVLHVGSVKTNIGHAEAAAGVAGLIKIVQMFRHRRIPGHLHFKTLNPRIRVGDVPLNIPVESVRWDAEGSRIAGVSSFGMSGTNAHVILEEPKATNEVSGDARPRPRLFTVSARHPDSLRRLAASCVRAFRDETLPFPEAARASCLRRSHLEHRLACVADDASEAARLLQSHLDGEPEGGVFQGHYDAGRPTKCAFVFSGNGSPWPQMGLDLFETDLAYKMAIEDCAEAVGEFVEWSLMDELSADISRARFAETDIVQPCIFAVQTAIARSLASRGVEPSAVAGHSLGEVAAAHAAGILSLRDAAHIIVARSALIRRVSDKGGAIIVHLPEKDAEAAIKEYGERLVVAALNGPKSTLIAGDLPELSAITEHFGKKNIFCRRVNMNYAPHSPHMDGLDKELERELREIKPQNARIPFHSTVHGKAMEGVEMNGTYWARNLRSPVRFFPVIAELSDSGFGVFTEIGPHPVLLHDIRGTISENTAAFGTLRRSHPGENCLLEACPMRRSPPILGVASATGAA